MKKSLLLGLGAVAMAFAAGAGIGANSLANRQESNLIATYAWDHLDSVWLKGSFNSWNRGDGKYNFSYVGDTKDDGDDCADFELVVNLTKDDTFGVEANGSFFKGVYSNSYIGNESSGDLNMLVKVTGTYRLHFRTNFSTKNYLYQVDNITTETNTIYFVNTYSWETVKCHHYNNVDGTTWHGDDATLTNMTLKCYVGDKEQDAITIYKMVIPAKHNWAIFNNNDDAQSDTYFVKDGRVYFHYEVSTNVYAEIVDLMLLINSKMASGSYSGRPYASTICAMSKDDADDIIDKYDKIYQKGGAYQSGVAGSAIITNDYEKPDGATVSYTLAEIRETLAKTVSAEKLNPAFVVNSANDKTVPLTIVAVSIASFAALGVIVLRARQKSE